ncbi:MAG: Ig-like domain-containing protein, partial [Gemmatimonadota bacterium]|nr:Ig-like domain-containing protein [Gemmatimonadota bacterium]
PSPAVIQMVNGNNQSAPVGSNLPNPFVVEVLDSSGRPVGGQSVSWTVVAGGGTMSPASSVTNASGEARSFLKLGNAPGQQRVRSSLGTLNPVEFTAMAMALSASQLAIVSGNSQEAMVGSQLSQPLLVRATDVTGSPVSGVTVTFTVTAGGGTVQPASAATDVNGHASTTWTLGSVIGAQSVTASAAGTNSAVFTATGRENNGTSLMIVSGNGQTGAVATVLPTPLTVRLLDGSGGPVQGATVLFSTTATNGTVTPTSATTNANGEASTSWRLGTLAGTQTATASVSGRTPASFTATATPGAASQLSIVSGNNQVAGASQPLPVPVVVAVTDAWENAVPAVDVAFSVTSGGGSITPATIATDANGRASASWTLGAQMGNQSAQATVSGIGNAILTATATPPIHGLNHRVVDAEFSATTNKIVTVSANPSRLHILDPETRAVQTIDLPQVPNALAVQPDGQFAAVGHDGWISYVNLTTRTVARVYSVTTDVLDIVLPGNGWVYAFPRTDQWETIRSINLSTGAESQTGTIYAGTLARLHPSGHYIYGANNGLSPSDFEKYDIRPGVAAFMYDSPYHGDYAFSGNVWISEDGLRLFARSGNVFRSSAVSSEDMRYAGKLQGMSFVQWAAQSTLAGIVVALPASWCCGDPVNLSEMRVYESTFLAYRGAVPLPRFPVPGVGSFEAEGKFLFFKADGERLYVLLKAEDGSGMALDWGLVVYDRADLP